MGQVFLLFGLSVPVIFGLVGDHDLGLILRDVLPFLFIGMPVFLAPYFKNHPQNVFKFLWTFAALGGIFSLRALAEQFEILAHIFLLSPVQELTYSANMPSVLFAGLFVFGIGARHYMRTGTTKSLFIFGASIIVGLAIIVPVALTAQRASMGYIALYGLSLAGVGLYRAPYRILPIMIVAGVLAIPFIPHMIDIFDMLYQKTMQVGVNNRNAELMAVWDVVSQNPVQTMFGMGWGGTFESPAVDGVRVNFTHSLLSAMLLKTGLVGVLITLGYLYGVGLCLLRAIRITPMIGFALAGPFAIDVLLYASYKSLDFGFLLLSIVIVSQSVAKD